MGALGFRDVPKRRMLIEPETREAIRDDKVSTKELDLLRRRAFLWAKAHREELSDGECQDVVSAAFLEVLPLIRDSMIDDVEVDLEFRRALGTRRTAAKRQSRRFASMDKIDRLISGGVSTGDSEQGFVQKDHLLRVAQTLKSLIAIAVDLLPRRSHDLIVKEYNLIPLGFSMRDPTSLEIPDGGYRVALFRARRRFHQILATVYDAAQTALHGDSARFKSSMQEAKKLAQFSESGQSALSDAAELVRLVASAKGFIGMAVDLLPDREHDCIVAFYGLERFGLSFRGPAASTVSRNWDSKIAQRARLVFMETFEAVLAAAHVALTHDRGVIEQALKLVQGEDVPEILETIGELEAKVRQ